MKRDLKALRTVLDLHRPNGDEDGMDDAKALDLLFRSHAYLLKSPERAMLDLGRICKVDWTVLSAMASLNADPYSGRLDS